MDGASYFMTSESLMTIDNIDAMIPGGRDAQPIERVAWMNGRASA
jgi:hypothetical protein